jgi:NitT/TauT family transport system substrate-binding protein
MYAALNRAVNRAVTRLNEDIRPYLKYLIREVPPEVMRLTPDDFYLPRFRYVAPRPYTREEYEHLHDWMTGWKLLDPESGYDRIVAASPAIPA